MPKQPRLQRLSIFLLKAGTTVEDVIESDASCNSMPVHESATGIEKVFVGASHAHPPAWRGFVERATTATLGHLVNMSSSALLIVRASDRLFAIPFGYGRNWIDERRVERRFGMKVTLNIVDSERIKSVDREELEAVVRTTRSQTSVVSNLGNFGIDVQRDLLRSVTGKPQDETFAKHVSGGDNLIISAALTIGDLADKCSQALEIYSRTTYRENGFDWIDNFQRVTDPERVARLNEMLVAEIRRDAPEHVYLSPPNIIDVQEHQGFKYPRERGEPHDDIRLDAYLERIGDRSAISVSMLQNDKIRHFTSDAEHPSNQFSVYDALVYEVHEGHKLFALTRGEWFEVEENYVKRIEARIAAIKSSAVKLPKAKKGEKEGLYNKRAASNSAGALDLLDCKPVQFGGKHSKIEVCDLLANTKELIHVKRGSQSALLSHLFNQGVVSGQLLRDDGFRKLAAKKCAASHAPLFDGSFKPGGFKVTFGIITGAAGELGNALPFFSKQSLANAADRLEGVGYKVALRKIELE